MKKGDSMFDLSEYIGRDIKDDLFECSNQIENFEFDGESGSYETGCRHFSKDAESEEYDWTLTTSVYFELEGCTIVNIEKCADVSGTGDSGLGECDPEEEWTQADYEKAKLFFDQITKNPSVSKKHKLLDRQGFEKEFRQYFKKYQSYDDDKIKDLLEKIRKPRIVCDSPFYQGYFETYEQIDGETYLRERNWFDFSMFDTFDSSYPFEHIIFYRLDEEEHSIQEYIDAEKLYEVIDVEE